MKTLGMLVCCVLLSPTLFGAAKCKVDGVGEGVIISEPHVIPNFKGDPVVIYVDACKVGTSIYRSGFKYLMMRPVGLTDLVGAICNGPVCRVPVSGVLSLRYLRAQLAGPAPRPVQPVDWLVRPGTPDVRTVLSELDAALARCPAQGDCQVPAALFAALQPRVAAGGSGNRSVDQFIARQQQQAAGGAVSGRQVPAGPRW